MRTLEQILQDTIRTLEEEIGNEDLVDELKEAMKTPTLRIPTKSGDLIVGVADYTEGEPEACIMLDVPEQGEIDLCLARADAEGNISIYNWDNVFAEEYSTSSVIKAEDIMELSEQAKRENEELREEYEARTE